MRQMRRNEMNVLFDWTVNQLAGARGSTDAHLFATLVTRPPPSRTDAAVDRVSARPGAVSRISMPRERGPGRILPVAGVGRMGQDF